MPNSKSAFFDLPTLRFSLDPYFWSSRYQLRLSFSLARQSSTKFRCNSVVTHVHCIRAATYQQWQTMDRDHHRILLAEDPFPPVCVGLPGYCARRSADETWWVTSSRSTEMLCNQLTLFLIFSDMNPTNILNKASNPPDGLMKCIPFCRIGYASWMEVVIFLQFELIRPSYCFTIWPSLGKQINQYSLEQSGRLLFDVAKWKSLEINQNGLPTNRCVVVLQHH